jgi:hypothetical protein
MPTDERMSGAPTLRIGHRGIIRMLALGLVTGCLVLAGFTVRLVFLNHHMSDDLGAFIGDPQSRGDVMLSDFPVQKQAYANSCGPTTLSMLRAFLIGSSSEQAIADALGIRLGQGGMLPRRFRDALKSTLPGFRVVHRTNIPDSDLLAETYDQLKRGIPVPIYFATVNDWNKPTYDTHYSVIIGMRPVTQEIILANAYGYREVMTYASFLDAAKYGNYRDAPLAFRLGVFFGVINGNNLFVVSRDPGP